MKAATFKCNRRRRRQRRALSLKVVTYWNREKEEIALHCKPITISRHKRNRLPTYLPIVTQRGKLRAMLSHTMFSTLDQLSIKSFSKHLFDHREREGHGEVGVTNVTRLSLHRKEKEDEEEVTSKWICRFSHSLARSTSAIFVKAIFCHKPHFSYLSILT